LIMDPDAVDGRDCHHSGPVVRRQISREQKADVF
jgi:hypothetical protein